MDREISLSEMNEHLEKWIKSFPKLKRSSFFDSYVFMRNFLFEMLEERINSDDDFKLDHTKIEDVLIILEDTKLIDKSYLDNLRLSINLKFNQKQSMTSTSRQQEVIDKRIKPDPRSDGWCFYDKVLGAIWILILQNYVSRRSADHFSLSVFGSSEKKLRDLCNEFIKPNKSEVKFNKQHQELFVDIALMVTYYRIYDKKIDIPSLKGRGKGDHKSSIDTFNKTKNTFYKIMLGRAFLALKDIKSILEDENDFINLLYTSDVKKSLIELSEKDKMDQYMNPFDVAVILLLKNINLYFSDFFNLNHKKMQKIIENNPT